MASRQRLAAAKTIKTKKVRASKAAQYLADTKHLGDEPVYTGKELVGLELIRVFNWYNYMCTKTDARDYIETYLKNTGRSKELKLHKSIPDVWVSLQAGWLARIISQGGKVNLDKFNELLKESLSHSTIDNIIRNKNLPKIEVSKSNDKTSNIIGELDETIDKQGWTIDVYDWLTKKGTTTSIAKRVKEFFKPTADEAIETTKKTASPQLLEGYRHYNKTQLKHRADFFVKLLQDCDRFIDSTTKRRAPRKTKVISTDKKLKTFQFQKESKDYKLVSIDPTKIMGSTELWAFNTKYKTLTVFKTKDGSTLDVKGTTIIGYDEQLSGTYRLGRKTENQLQTVLNSTKRSLPKFLTTLKSTTLQHRSGDTTILLKVF